MSKRMLYSLVLFLSCLFFLPSLCLSQDARPRIGLSISPLQASPILLQHLRLAPGEGLMVKNIAVGSQLEAAGLSQGDILLAIDGKPLSTPQELSGYIEKLPQNAQVMLDVIQKGEHRQIAVTLDALPSEIVWKYVQPISGPGRVMGSGGRSFPLHGAQTPIPSGSSTSSAVFQSVISTPQGFKTSTVRFSGPTDAPDTEVRIDIDGDSWKTTVSQIEQLPEEPKKAVQNALKQSQNFSFGFSNDGNDIFREMMKRQQEQMQRFNEMFNRQFNAPADPFIPMDDDALPETRS